MSEAKHMHVMQHAIRRYKKRIGYRTSNKKRTISYIINDIHVNETFRTPRNEEGFYRIYTTNMIAVCKGKSVVTILNLDSEREDYLEDEVWIRDAQEMHDECLLSSMRWEAAI